VHFYAFPYFLVIQLQNAAGPGDYTNSHNGDDAMPLYNLSLFQIFLLYIPLVHSLLIKK
jgi:hypothetical protein